MRSHALRQASPFIMPNPYLSADDRVLGGGGTRQRDIRGAVTADAQESALPLRRVKYFNISKGDPLSCSNQSATNAQPQQHIAVIYPAEVVTTIFRTLRHLYY